MRSCPKCKSSEYGNRFFKLMINICGHSLCSYCVEKIFTRNSGPCPTCGKTLSKNNFWEQQFDDPIVEKEVYFRKKLLKKFNLKLEDFTDLNSYNQYLENFEEIIFNFVFDRDLEETEQKIKEFTKEYSSAIDRNRARKSKDEEWIEMQLKEEKYFRERTKNYRNQETVEVSGFNDNDTSEFEIINELMKSDLPAELVVGNKRRKLDEARREQEEKDKLLNKSIAAVSSGLPKINSSDSFNQHVYMSMSEKATGEQYTYEPYILVSNGPQVPEVESLQRLGYLNNIKTVAPPERAAGYTEEIACQRALSEAFCDLYL